MDTAVQCAELRAHSPVAAATQTDATGKARPHKHAQRTVSNQTDSDAASQLLLSQLGRSPLAKGEFEVCQVIRGAVEKATKNARRGHIKQGQQELFEVSDCITGHPWSAFYLVCICKDNNALYLVRNLAVVT